MPQSSSVTSARNKRRGSSGSTASSDSDAPDAQGTTAEPRQGWYVTTQAPVSQPQQVDSDEPEARLLARRRLARYKGNEEPPFAETTGPEWGIASTPELDLPSPRQDFPKFLNVPCYGDIKLKYDRRRCRLIVEDDCENSESSNTIAPPSEDTIIVPSAGIKTLVLMVQEDVTIIPVVVRYLVGVGFPVGDTTKIEVPPLKTYKAPKIPSPNGGPLLHPIEVVVWSMDILSLLHEIFEATQGKMPKLARENVTAVPDSE